MGELLAKVLPFALVGAISPILLTEIVFLLGSRERPRARAVAYALGVATFTVGLGIALLLLFRAARGGAESGESTAQAVLDVVIGLLVIAVAVWGLVRKPKEKPERHEHRPRLWAAYLFGVASMATNFSTLVVYVAAVKEIDRAAAGAASDVAALALVDLIVLAPVLVPLALDVVAHDWVARQIARLQRTIASPTGRKVTAVLVAAIGAYVLQEGIRAL